MQSIHTSETNMTGVKVKFNDEPSGSTEVKEVYACTSVAGKGIQCRAVKKYGSERDYCPPSIM